MFKYSDVSSEKSQIIRPFRIIAINSLPSYERNDLSTATWGANHIVGAH